MKQFPVTSYASHHTPASLFADHMLPKKIERFVKGKGREPSINESRRMWLASYWGARFQLAVGAFIGMEKEALHDIDPTNKEFGLHWDFEFGDAKRLVNAKFRTGAGYGEWMAVRMEKALLDVIYVFGTFAQNAGLDEWPESANRDVEMIVDGAAYGAGLKAMRGERGKRDVMLLPSENRSATWWLDE